MVTQTAFNRGELDPALYGRNDWQPYFSGAKKIRNMVCRPQGGAVRRAGTEMIAETIISDRRSTFILFQFAVQQTYMLEFSEHCFRVFMDGGIVVYPPGHAWAGAQVVVTSPFSAADMAKVRVAQTEDLMILTHPNYKPRILVRHDHHIWIFETLELGTSINPPAVVRLDKDGWNGAKYVVSSVNLANEESLPSDVVQCQTAHGNPVVYPADVWSLTIDDCRHWWTQVYGQTWPAEWDVWNMTIAEIVGGNMMDEPRFLQTALGYTGRRIFQDASNLYWIIYRPDGYQVKLNAAAEYLYQWIEEAVYGMNQNWGGILAEMRNRIHRHYTAINENAWPNSHSIVSWDGVAGAARYIVYRSVQTAEGERLYKLGETNQTSFDDDNLAFESTQTPQVSNQPFEGEGNYPGVCAFYQQRLILGRTNNKPATIWGSRTGAYRNFNRDEGAISDTSAFEHSLHSDVVSEILWIVPMADLLVGTAGGEWRVSGRSGPISATSVSAVRQSNYGCSPINPIVVGQAVMGVGRKERVIRSYRWNYTGDAYQGTDVSHYAAHLFRRRQIGDIAYQAEPESILWVVMSDGSMLSCTYMNEEEVLGWTRHDTDGRFQSVASYVTTAGQDEIWVIVARDVAGQTKYYIERMKDVQEDGDDIADAWYVDSGLARVGAATTYLGGLWHLEGKRVVCLGDGNVYKDLVVAGGAVNLPVAVSKAIVGLPFAAELETMELEPLQGGTIAPAGKEAVVASVLFYHSRECHYDNGGRPYEVKFNTSPQIGPIRPETIRKNLSLDNPIGEPGLSLRLRSESPVPFGVLSVAVTLNPGPTAPRPGKALVNRG